MNLYPKLIDKSFSGVLDWIERVNSERQSDRKDADNLKNIMVLGRNRTLLNNRATPSASNDVVATDRQGDIMHDATHLYILIDNAGTLAWRRASLSSF